MTNFENGARVELLVRDDLQAHGYAVVKAAGSKGAADLVAFRPGVVAFVQVKTGKRIRIDPAERVALIALADHLGPHIAAPIVATKPARKPITYRLLTGPGPKDWIRWAPAVTKVG